MEIKYQKLRYLKIPDAIIFIVVSTAGQTIVAISTAGQTIVAISTAGQTIVAVSTAGQTIVAVSTAGQTAGNFSNVSSPPGQVAVFYNRHALLSMSLSKPGA